VSAFEAAYPSACEPAAPQFIVAFDTGELFHGADATEVDEHASEVE
jgi:hypothetical protein